ncbi:MAG: flagellar basal-body rod protein FlgF [Acidobacteriia bacterium]|nr:flagellar basal-body rod protein FlgF [Terriglobia bacterium]
MDSGFYAACAGLRAQSQALEVSAHNLANVNTAGFRGQQTTFQSLLAVANPTVPTVLNLATNNFGVLEGSHLDRTAGNLEHTGNLLDLGIEGAGFFVIQTAGGTRYTRNGSFRVARSGELVTAAGDPVLGDQGVIRVPAGAISVSADGTLSVNGAAAGTIRLVEFTPGARLTSESGTLVAAPDGSTQPAKLTAIQQGTLESSNVNAIQSVMTLIGVQRHAEMLQRALSLFDSEFNRIATSELPRV